MDAYFASSAGEFLQTSQNLPSLRVAAGTITVKNATTTGGELSFDIQFATSAGDSISVAGALNYGNCTVSTTRSCS